MAVMGSCYTFLRHIVALVFLTYSICLLHHFVTHPEFANMATRVSLSATILIETLTSDKGFL